jgi:hypothetical protein
MVTAWERTLKRTAAAGGMLWAVSLSSCATDSSAPNPGLELRRPILGAAATTEENVLLKWDEAALAAIRQTRPGPPQAARALAIAHTSMFDAWAAYDAVAVGTRLGGTLRRPAAERTLPNKERAVSYAAYRALVDLFPSQTPAFDALMANLGYPPNDFSTDVTTAIGIGNAAAAAVIAFRHHDGSNQLGDLHPGSYSDYTGYAPVNTPDQINDPNRWQPLRVSDGHGGTGIQTFVAPFWGRVIPFALTSGAQFRPPVLPNQFPFGGYQKEVEEILKYSSRLTDEQKVIAEYWADGPGSELPPGHWCLFAAYVSRRDAHDIDADAKMFFALANAVFDVSISVWEAKRFFDSVRPITAVHFWKQGKMIRAWGGPGRGTIVMRGEDWQPYQVATVVTPPFGEFPSGHSAFSAASAEILKRFTGSDRFGASVSVAPATSRVEPGLVPAHTVNLAWPTFSAAADEASISRRYGGIHFVQGDLQSRVIGRQIAAQTWIKAQAYIQGTADP